MEDKNDLVVLGIESSCDDTAAAVVSAGKLRSNVVSSQLVHAGYGGVVPELASRAHQQLIVPVVNAAIAEAGVTKEQVDGVAVTYGPGLAGSLLVGLSFAKAYAFGLDVPLIGVNHLEGHLYSVSIEPPVPPFPFVNLIVSGGHTQLVLVEEGFKHTVLGKTRDDAAGEAFDKVAKLLGLGYPGGPVIDKLAQNGDPSFHTFPRTKMGMNFSFSGIKTAVLYYLNAVNETERTQLLETHLADICAAFQQAVVEMLVHGVKKAVQHTRVRHVALSGGVSANSALRAATKALGERMRFEVYAPPLKYCMDNAAMIAMTGYHKWQAGYTSPLTLSAEPSLRTL